MSVFHREIELGSGTRCSVMTASGCLGLVKSYLEEAETRHLIYELRQFCLGHQVSEKAINELQAAELLEKDGTLHPAMKAIVLASVRGEDHALFVVSPFTTAWDRTLAEYLQARNHIRAELSRDEAEAILLERDPLPEVLKAFVLKRSRKFREGNSP